MDEVKKAYKNFKTKVFEDGKLNRKTKELIAIAVASAIQCKYCIDSHTPKAKDLGATNDEIEEAVYVASVIRCGATLSHGKRAWD